MTSGGTFGEMRASHERTAVPAGREIDQFAVVLAAATIALIPVARGWVLWSADGVEAHMNGWVSVSPADSPLALLLVLQVVRGGRVDPGTARPEPRSVALRLLTVTLMWTVLCGLINPSWRALDLAFHIAGAWALVRTFQRSTDAERILLLWALTMVGTVEGLLGIAQALRGENLGLDLLELPGELFTVGEATAAIGGFAHPYHLTAFLVVAVSAAAVLAQQLRGASRWAVLGMLLLMGTAIPLTYSRASVFAVIPMLLAWSWRSSVRPIALFLAIGLVVGLGLGFDGIRHRAEQSTDANAVDSGRRVRLTEALSLVDQEPVFGVGPGRYVLALAETDHEQLLPAHNVVAQAAAETGVPGGLLMLSTAIAFALWLARESPMTIGVGASLVPFHLLDSYPHVFPVGLVTTGLWLSVICCSREVARQCPDQP
jgi:hypothetical protein